MWPLLRSILFRLDPESAHDLAGLEMRTAASVPGFLSLLAQWTRPPDRLAREVAGLHFPGPLGLAAGFDKTGLLYPFLAALGFGFVECGTFTAISQSGNPRPRLFRYPQYKALVNRMGFNNPGAARASANLEGVLHRVPLGINIGKSKVTELADAEADYLRSLDLLYDRADYMAINVSSPNTPGLRKLQKGKSYSSLLNALRKRIDLLARQRGRKPAPLFCKVAPDMSVREFNELVDRSIDAGVSGLILTNTTVEREGLPDIRESGGLSGRPLQARSTEWLARARSRAGRRLALIGVGGIFKAEDALEKLNAGADLLQAYTGFIYEGPGFARNLQRQLLKFQNSI